MKKVSVVLEISEDIYEDVVKPLKAEKSFGKVMSLLLEAYYESEAVYSYVSGLADGVNMEENSELMSDLRDMADSISFLSAQADSMKSVIDKGREDMGLSEERKVSPPEEKNTEGYVTESKMKEYFQEMSKDIMNSIKEMFSSNPVGSERYYEEPKKEDFKDERVIPRSESYFEEPSIEEMVASGLEEYKRTEEDEFLPEDEFSPVMENDNLGFDFSEDTEDSIPTQSKESQEKAMSALSKLTKGLF